MGKDHPLAERDGLAAAHEPFADVIFAGDIVDLVVHINRLGVLALENPLVLPLFEGLGAADIAVVAFVVAVENLIENQSHDIVRVLRVELVLKFRRNNVVRRGDDIRKRPDSGGIVTVSGKGLNIHRNILS